MAVQYDFDLVGKIGSMALIRREDADIDYNIFSRLGRELRPGMIWVTSGAAEIGRLDYMRRTGRELTCDSVDAKTDYAAQGQTILMEQYRHFIRQEYSVRQVLVEHQHFNDEEKREHIRRLFLRARDDALRKPQRAADDEDDAPARIDERREFLRKLHGIHLLSVDAQRDDDIPLADFGKDRLALLLPDLRLDGGRAVRWLGQIGQLDGLEPAEARETLFVFCGSLAPVVLLQAADADER